jgi:O-antigen ligase
MTRVNTLDAPRVRHAATLFWAASATVLALSPVAMTVANRSSALLFTVSAVLALIAAVMEGRVRSVIEVARELLFSTLIGRLITVFFLWTVLSATWSTAPSLTLHYLAEFWVPAAAGFVLWLLLPARITVAHMFWMVGAVAVASAVIIIGLLDGAFLRETIGLPVDRNFFNRPTITTLLCVVPAANFLWSSAATTGRMAGRRLIMLLIIAVWLSASSSAMLAGSVALLLFLLLRAGAHWPFKAAMVVLVLATFSAPLMGTVGEKIVPEPVHAALEGSSSKARLAIWTAFAETVAEAPLVGSGFGTTANIQHGPGAARVRPEYRPMLAQLHPHNTALQVWVELGFVGAVLLAAILVLIGRSWSHLPLQRRNSRMILLLMVSLIALVSHGAWQGWWAAAVGASFVWLGCAEQVFDNGAGRKLKMSEFVFRGRQAATVVQYMLLGVAVWAFTSADRKVEAVGRLVVDARAPTTRSLVLLEEALGRLERLESSVPLLKEALGRLERLEGHVHARGIQTENVEVRTGKVQTDLERSLALTEDALRRIRALEDRLPRPAEPTTVR